MAGSAPTTARMERPKTKRPSWRSSQTGKGSRAVVIAPDAGETGTNALLLRPPFLLPFSFGPVSFARHCALARAAGVEPLVYRSPSLAHDIDLPDDLRHLDQALAREFRSQLPGH